MTHAPDPMGAAAQKSAWEADVAALLEKHGLEMVDSRERIETYRVVDRTGSLRGQGLSREKAEALAGRLAEDISVAPVEMVQVLHWSFTQRSLVRVFGREADLKVGE